MNSNNAHQQQLSPASSLIAGPADEQEDETLSAVPYLPAPQRVFAVDADGPDLSREAIWLLLGLLLCAFMIIGCACCSLRFTQMQQRRRIELDDAEAAARGIRSKLNNRSSVNGASGGGSFAASIGLDISGEFDNSMDHIEQTSTSAK